MTITPELSADSMTTEAQEIINAYYELPQAEVTLYGGGLINTTYLVANPAARLGILQKLSEMFPPEVNNDFTVVTDHLRADGWEAPKLLPNKVGARYIEIGKSVWRVMSYIESDPLRPTSPTDENYHDFGNMLARFHASLQSLDYTLAYSIPHFHETEYHADRLQQVLTGLPDDATQSLAEDMLSALHHLPDLPLSKVQLIHGDPQTSNSLFKDGKPLTFIDFDTLMLGPIWTDIGDMLRSLAEDVIEQGGEFPVDRLRLVADGYRQAAAPDVDSDEFFGWALTATQKISLELGMRFITDLAPGQAYWGYDPARFSSREELCRHRGGIQWQLYQLAKAEKDKVIHD